MAKDIYSHSLRAPWLLLPPQQEDEEQSNTCGFFSLKEDKFYSVNNMPPEFGKSHCVGSSNGWLVLLNEQSEPYLFNPFSQTRIQLPSLETSPCITQVSKAILSLDPSHNNNNWVVIVIYGERSKLAYCKCGDSSWRELHGKKQPYRDIIFHDDSLLALADSSSVEFWDLNKPFTLKMKEFECSFPVKTAEIGHSLGDLCSTNSYLVESANDILFIVRFIGNFVNQQGKPVTEADLLTDEDTHPLVCPYRTLFFHVYKLDSNQKKWLEVESLGDRVLFLGANHSVSLSARDFPECRKNLIYFTDDNWDEMDLDYLYGGHDMGVYNLEDKNIKPFFSCDEQKIIPPPIWAVPNLQ